MNINIYDYLEDLEKKDLPNENGIIVEDSNRTKYIHSAGGSSHPLYLFQADNLRLFVKDYSDKDRKTSISYLVELLASRIYEKHGVNAIRIYPFKSKFWGNDTMCVASQDLYSIPDLTLSDNNEFLSEYYNKRTYNNQILSELQTNEWCLITLNQVKDSMLNFMTEECFEQLVNLIIIDTFFAQADRFGDANNLFFAKSKGSEKWEGIVAIDLESINFDYLKNELGGSVNDFLNALYEIKLPTVSPHGPAIAKNLEEKIDMLGFLARNGFFSPKQVKLIQDILNINISGEISDITTKYHLDIDDSFEEVFRNMWEYDNELIRI